MTTALLKTANELEAEIKLVNRILESIDTNENEDCYINNIVMPSRLSSEVRKLVCAYVHEKEQAFLAL